MLEVPAAVGLLGGTFDPIHSGHIACANWAKKILGLSELRLLPAAVPPLKERPAASAEQRLAMVSLACADHPGLRCDARELTRSGPSYTWQTLVELRAELTPETPLVFVLGEDALEGLERWHRWEDLLGLCHFAVLRRGDGPLVLSPGLSAMLEQRVTAPQALLESAAGGVAWLQQPLYDVSSTVVRARLLAGEPVDSLLPKPVIEYIKRYDIYSSPSAAS